MYNQQIESEFRPISPVHALGDTAKLFVNELASELATDYNLVACILFSIFAAAQLGIHCTISREYVIIMSFYLAVAAPSGAGKSPALKRLLTVFESLVDKHVLLSPEDAANVKDLIEMFQERKKRLIKKFAKSEGDNEEDYKDKVSEITKKLADLKIPISPIIGNISIQSFVKEIAARDGYGIQFDAEGGLLSEFHTVRVSELSPVMQAWSNERISDCTKKEQIVVDNTSVVMMNMLQNNFLYDVVRDARYREKGVAARYLVYLVNSWTPFLCSGHVSDNNERWYKEQLEGVMLRSLRIRDNASLQQYTLSAEAQNLFDRFKRHLVLFQSQGFPYFDYKDIAAKLDVQAIRLAIIIHAINTRDHNCLEIGYDTLLKACCLSLYFANNTVDIINNSSFDEMKKEAFELMEMIAACQNGFEAYIQLDFNAEESRRTLGWSKTRFDKVCMWMRRNMWIKNYIKTIKKDGKDIKIEVWRPNVQFKNLLNKY